MKAYLCNISQLKHPLKMTASKRPTTGVIISTYNNPKWLEKTLIGYMHQTLAPDEIIIADDGSGPETARLIASYSTRLPLRHVWHPDEGFRKTRILNAALAQATADYLIFTDQDCVPRHDFVSSHIEAARPGHFISGGYFKLPMEISQTITHGDIATGRAFSLSWLKQGSAHNVQMHQTAQPPVVCLGNERHNSGRASWNGCNSSGWRADMLAINGFDERMEYGGEDREFGERLVNAGLKPIQRRYSAIAVHLDHGRPYKNTEALDRNMAIRRATKRNHTVVTPYGINRHDNGNTNPQK